MRLSDAVVSHADGYGDLHITGIPDEGMAKAKTNISQMSMAMRNIFGLTTNVVTHAHSYDAAARYAAKLYWDYTQAMSDSPGVDPQIIPDEHPNVRISARNFWNEDVPGVNRPVQLVSTREMLRTGRWDGRVELTESI